MKHTSFRRLWGMPLLMGVLIIIGLLAALLGTGGWHVLSWIALSVPVAIVVRYGLL